MSIEPDGQASVRQSLAEALRELRKAAGLSGERLAARCSMSQSKISRIELGEVLPSVIDVELIVKALDVPSEIADELINLARQANIDYKSWRTYARLGLWQKQAEIKALEKSAKCLRYFLPAMPTGLLHIEEYARQVLTPTIKGRAARDVSKAVKARLGRQEVLNDLSRRFVFLMTEQAVRWEQANLDVMAAQTIHMAEVSTRPNVEIGILPQGVKVQAPPLNGFAIYDDRLTTVELFSGEVVLRDPRDIGYHLNLFDFFLSHALTGEDATRFLLSVADDFTREGG